MLRVGWAVALIAGVALGLAQVPWSLLPLGLAGLALALWRMARATTPWRAAGLGWCFGFGHFLISLHWIYHPFQVDAARDGWMAPFAVVLMPAGLALFWALAGGFGWWAARPRARVLGLALALALAEGLRAAVLTGFPWAMPGHIWLGWPGEQLAALIGAQGLTLITLALVALALHGRRGAAVSVAGLAAMLIFGQWQGNRPVQPDRDFVVRLVQPNAEQHLKWQAGHWRRFYQRQLDLTATPRPRAPDLVLWPETAVPFLLEDADFAFREILDAAQGAPVVLGIQRLDGARAYNSLAQIEGSAGAARVVAVYDKHHLVPFGEYIPLGDALFEWADIGAFAASQGMGYSPGPGPALLDLGPMGQAAALICYEAVFPYMLRRQPQRPDWVLQATNDAWFGQSAGPFQHLSLARLRAIEFGLPVLRVANTGVSAAIDARGRITAQLGLGQIGALDVTLPAALAPTVYARLGDAPVWLLWLFGLLFLRWRRAH